MKSPLLYRKVGALDWFCLRAIAFYQSRISPRKGWRCAHARLNGGTGCSGFVREAIEIYGLRAALPQIRARFGECKLAAQDLRAQNASDANSDENSRAKRNRQFGWGDQVCVDFNWFCCAESLLDGSACEAASCADASCAHGACADASCADAACGCHSCW